MRTLNGSLQPEGARVDVQLGLAAANVLALRNAGRPIPAAIPARALIDTGAEVTCADPQVLAPLTSAGLRPTRFVFANLPATGGLGLCAEYPVGLTILHPSNNPRDHLVLRTYVVVEQGLGALGYQVLIGRDVLAACFLVYDGPSRRFTLAY